MPAVIFIKLLKSSIQIPWAYSSNLRGQQTQHNVKNTLIKSVPLTSAYKVKTTLAEIDDAEEKRLRSMLKKDYREDLQDRVISATPSTEPRTRHSASAQATLHEIKEREVELTYKSIKKMPKITVVKSSQGLHIHSKRSGTRMARLLGQSLKVTSPDLFGIIQKFRNCQDQGDPLKSHLAFATFKGKGNEAAEKRDDSQSPSPQQRKRGNALVEENT
ncbi:hypothetical protein V8E54_007347 [Elaphomyces granulatus]